MSDILVSINCITYNHEKYIAEAIESFLMQNTDFKFEILIHDDASTDRSAEIIREYEQKYPDLIKPIYQTENQYSKKVQVDRLNTERAQGKYIAVCEGDDFWTDPYKLQKQVDYMEAHPEVSLCVHAGDVVLAKDRKVLRKNRPSKFSRFLTVEEIIKLGGDFCVTSAMFYRTELDRTRPDFFNVMPDISDYHLGINLALQGAVYYMDECMSAYRVGVVGSWTVSNYSNLKKKKEHNQRLYQMLDEINEYTNYQYNETIQHTKNELELLLLLEERKFKEAKSDVYKEIYASFGVKRKVIITLDKYAPALSNYLRAVKRGY
ncbi:glycosyltransferase family 2 protein [Ureibacillus sp. MALMAid1270]|uniref:glycosyltransferase family 2 protein n=1 Tax=Ureibacillus sp. MALMAid1270 TaxID=3411629 RepID=UPI003BA4A7E3